MQKTKQKILNTALDLYNSEGVSNVSIRRLAQNVGISHSNLIYHFPTQEDILLGLHDMLLQEAMKLNKDMKRNGSPLLSLFHITRIGFSIVYEFRFLFKDLHYICSSFPRVKMVVRDVEHIRSEMYKEVIQKMISAELFRKEDLENEFDDLITLIKIYSDHWLVSAAIYDDLPESDKINKYAYLFMVNFYPYLTEKGRKEFNEITIKTPDLHY